MTRPKHYAGRNFPCPKCNGPMEVINSRPYKRGIRRRRQCKKCGAKTWTVEMEGDLHDLRESVERMRAVAQVTLTLTSSFLSGPEVLP